MNSRLAQQLTTIVNTMQTVSIAEVLKRSPGETIGAIAGTIGYVGDRRVKSNERGEYSNQFFILKGPSGDQIACTIWNHPDLKSKKDQSVLIQSKLDGKVLKGIAVKESEYKGKTEIQLDISKQAKVIFGLAEDPGQDGPPDEQQEQSAPPARSTPPARTAPSQSNARSAPPANQPTTSGGGGRTAEDVVAYARTYLRAWGAMKAIVTQIHGDLPDEEQGKLATSLCISIERGGGLHLITEEVAQQIIDGQL